MSIRTSLQVWDESQALFDRGDLRGALSKLQEVPESQKSAKTFFNIGTVHVLLDDPESALMSLNQCVTKDQHLAVAYFQRGTVYNRLGRMQEALVDFEECLTCLRGNKMIDYKQLGLRFKLYSCEVLYNMASNMVNLGDFGKALNSLQQADGLKMESRHQCIGDAIKLVQARRSFPLMEVKMESLYFRPAKTKTAALQRKDYLGKAKVVATVDDSDTFAGFAGPRLLEAGQVKTVSRSLPNSPLLRRRDEVRSSPALASPDLPRKPSSEGNAMHELKEKLANQVALGKTVTPVSQLSDASSKQGRFGNAKPLTATNRHPLPDRKPPSIVITDDAPSEPPPRPPKTKSQSKPVVLSSTGSKPLPPPKPLPPRRPGIPPKSSAETTSKILTDVSAKKPRPVPRYSNTMTVELECLGVHALRVKSDISLSELERLANEKLAFEQGTVALWYHPKDSEPYSVDSDATLRQLCQDCDGSCLHLHGYSRS